MVFQDRKDAGERLGEALNSSKRVEGAVVIGLAKGGVVVAAEVARCLGLSLDVLVVRKVGAPDNSELALGAVAGEGHGVFNEELIARLGVSKEYVEREAERQREEIVLRNRLYRKERRAIPLAGKDVIIVDDGIATGSSVEVAIAAIRAEGASKIVLAVPVASKEALDRLTQEVDKVVCLSTPLPFFAVGAFYESFSQVTDEEVCALIHKR